MNRISISVNKIVEVLAYYDVIKVYRADSENGTYSEITNINTRIPMIAETLTYYYEDVPGNVTHWYKTSYYHSVNAIESAKSAAMRGSSELERIGYSFRNYSAPPGEWGTIMTPDDLRYTYMWGIDATAKDVAESEMEDEQFQYFIDAATEDFEDYLTIKIKKRIFKTRPANTLIRSQDGVWRQGVDYTDEEDPYDFDPSHWGNYGFIQLRYTPVISIERAVLYSPVRSETLDLLNNGWVRLTKATGQIHLYPTGNLPYGPFIAPSAVWRYFGVRFPQGFEFDYTAGYENSDLVPKGLRDVIGKWACTKALATVGDGLLAGFSSQSVSLDGLSESFSSTQSATSAYFGARILSYQREIKDWLERNRHKFGAIPFSFVGM